MAESHDHVRCTEVVELVTDYLERSLPPDEAALVEQHLNCCEGCVGYVDQIRTTIETLGGIEPEEGPPQVRAQLLTAFRDWTRSYRRQGLRPDGSGAVHGVPVAAADGELER